MFGRDTHEEPRTQPTPAAVEKVDRMSIVLFSGTVDKLLAASVLATGAAAMGLDVEIFLSNWGVMALRKDDYKSNGRISVEYADYQGALREAMHNKKPPTWMENLMGAREIGNVHIAACSLTMDLFDLRLEDLEPIVDEITGVASFIDRAHTSKITLFI